MPWVLLQHSWWPSLLLELFLITSSQSRYFANVSCPGQLYSNTMVHRQKRKKVLEEEDGYVFPGENQSSVSLHPLLFSPGLAHTGIHAVCISMLMEIKR